MRQQAGQRRRLATIALAMCLALLSGPHALEAQAPAPATGVKFAHISEADARTWLTYLSSDLMQGRQVFTEGYGLAASYIAGELKALGVKPLGDQGTFLQAVTRRGYQVTRNSSVTIEVAGVSKTFRHGDHVTFPVQAGGKQTLRFSDVEFAGNDDASEKAAAAGPAPSSRLVLYASSAPPRAVTAARSGRRRAGAIATDVMRTRGAAAAIGFTAAPGPDRPERPAPPARSGNGPAVDFTTMQRVDALVPPAITADESVFAWLFSATPAVWADVRDRLDAGKPLPSLVLRDVRVTIDVDNVYQVATTERTQNVVGMVEGTDPKLKDTYVFFGAHLDHVGYVKSDGQANGRVNVPVTEDPIWNGADDDGSGSTAVLAIAKAFATGPKPKRSVVFVWHAGEEAGLLGSQYMADFPVVPLDKVQVELNIDMIGRNRDNKADQINTVYLIGADRISTDLHNLLVEVNRQSDRPLTFDYEFNDPADPNSFYTRSDHYSYASKGIPITFFFTGEHPDYHANTDSVEKIIFPKLVRIAQLIYETGFAIANSEQVLERDNLGSRSGRGFQGTLPTGH